MTERRITFLHEEIERLQAELKALDYINIVCAKCGSDDMLISATVRWDIETQEYNVVNIFNRDHECTTCGPCDIKEVPA